jgi:hypothetical protein
MPGGTQGRGLGSEATPNGVAWTRKREKGGDFDVDDYLRLWAAD